MTWKPTDHVDEQVRGWMRAKRWEVTATDYHVDIKTPGVAQTALRFRDELREGRDLFKATVVK